MASSARTEQWSLWAGRPSSASATALLVSCHGLVDGLALDHFGGHGGGGDGAAAAEGLELHVLDDVVLDLQVDLHDVAALGVADLADAVGVLDLANVSGMLKMIHNFFTVQCHNFILLIKSFRGNDYRIYCRLPVCKSRHTGLMFRRY